MDVPQKWVSNNYCQLRQLRFLCRLFVYQWVKAKEKKKSVRPRTIWFVSCCRKREIRPIVTQKSFFCPKRSNACFARFIFSSKTQKRVAESIERQCSIFCSLVVLDESIFSLSIWFVIYYRVLFQEMYLYIRINDSPRETSIPLEIGLASENRHGRDAEHDDEWNQDNPVPVGFQFVDSVVLQ